MSTEVKAIDMEFIAAFIKQHSLAVEGLTERQLAEAFRQALASGDFVRYVLAGKDHQSVVYLPFREVEWLKDKNLALNRLMEDSMKVMRIYINVPEFSELRDRWEALKGK